MNYSVFRFTLNMHSLRSQTSVSAFCGDTAIQLRITLTDGGLPYLIADGCTAVLSGTKADGTKLHNRCMIENNATIVYNFTEQTTSCVGIANCEITLYGTDGDVITSPKFILVVDEREVGYNDVVDSVNEKTALDNIFTSEGARVAAEEDRVQAELSRAQAETDRASAEGNRASAEESREAAEGERASAEKARADAESLRVRAHESRIDGFAALDKRLHTLELANEGNTYAFRTDLGLAYTKAFHADALPYATIDKLGGLVGLVNTEKDFTPTAYKSLSDGGSSGGSVTYNESDNSYTFNGYFESASPTIIADHDTPKTLPMGTYTFGINLDTRLHVIVEAKKGGNVVYASMGEETSVTFSLPNGADSIYLAIDDAGGVGFDTEVVKPRLVKNEEIVPFPVSAIKVKGKNLLPNEVKDLDNWYDVDTKKAFNLHFPCDGWYAISAKLAEGYKDKVGTINFYVQRKGANGTFTASSAVYTSKGELKSGYYITANSESGFDYGNTIYVKFAVGEEYRFIFYNPNQDKLDMICDLQIEKCDACGATQTDYTPYSETDYHIPEAVQSLEGYGLGISADICNYIDFAEKTFVRMVALRAYQEGDINSDTMVTDGETTVYALSEVEKVDLSDKMDFDGGITIEGNGWLTLVNEAKAEVPFSTTYQIKL